MTYSAHAAETIFVSEEVLAKNNPTIQRVEAYLSRLNTLVSEFKQTAPDGSQTTGKFYLSRPGKMRWQYDPPTPVLMVSNGSELVYYDYELEQVTYIPLSGSLVSFLARDPIRFSGEVGITAFYADAKVIRIEVAQHDKLDEGKLMLEFAQAPIALRNMVVTDSTGQVTTVSLKNAKFGIDISPDLFVFKDPRKSKRR